MMSRSKNKNSKGRTVLEEEIMKDKEKIKNMTADEIRIYLFKNFNLDLSLTVINKVKKLFNITTPVEVYDNRRRENLGIPKRNYKRKKPRCYYEV